MNANYKIGKLLVTLLALSLLSLLISCGTRKLQTSVVKDSSATEKSANVDNNIQKSTDTFTAIADSSTEINIVPIDTTKPLTVNNITYKNARLSIVKKKVNTTIAKKEMVADLSKKSTVETIRETKQVATKQLERTSSNLWFLLWLLVPIGIYLAYLYVKKQLWFTNIISKLF